MKRYPIAKPYLTDKDRSSVMAVLNSPYLSLGPRYKEFEKLFAKKIGAKYACAVSSGTAGLHLAMIAAGIGPGDEVITTPFSFIASANCILYVGATPVFVDIDPVTYNMEPAEIEKRLTKKTKAILVVHIFGQAAGMTPILKIAKKHKLKIIEDACESVGAKYNGQNTGTFGESAVFAFYPNKQMTTGEGGMVVTDSRKIYELCASLRNQGRAENMQWLDHQYLGYNYRMDEMSAALGIAQLQKLDFMIKKRQELAGWYSKHLGAFPGLVGAPITARGNSHTWFVYVVKIKNKKTDRNLVIKDLQKSGVSTKPYLPSIHMFSFYKDKFSFKKGDFLVAEAASQSTLALPFYIGLQEKDIKYICNKLIKVLKHHDEKSK
ncbi:MAG: DegT/DnrJ/EryC1/StrS family aminotransferase [Candidatus Yanofskybacteria bacterium]|nr:DegT/DnrJ/EryC1/StrS family aminotransferase [Candidatus Yanofskybacteria bacterium]